MIYYNHTQGESFTLDGFDYIGDFHVSGGKCYTGKLSNIDTKELSPKNNFTSEVFSNSWYYNTSFNNISTVQPININANDLLNRQGLEDFYNKINKNNLKIFKNLIIPNPVVYNYNERFCRFFAQSEDDNPEVLGTKPRYETTIKNLSNKWKFINKIVDGVVLVDSSENFKYFCTTGVKDYVIFGNFNSDTPLEIISERTNIDYNDSSLPADYTYGIAYDTVENRIIMVRSKAIEIYDASNFEECDKFILIDRIERTESSGFLFTPRLWNTVNEKFGWTDEIWNKNSDVNVEDRDNSKFIKFGKNLRTYIKGDTLFLYNKYSKFEYSNINLSSNGIIEPLAIDIRDIDDFIAILHFDGGFKITTIDLSTANPTIKTTKIKGFRTDDNYQIKFSPCDSDTIFVTSTRQFHTRSIENLTYITGKLENCDLGYGNNSHIWNEVDELFSFYKNIWNDGDRSERNNTFINISHSSRVKNGKFYTILVNHGRLYALKQGVNDRYYHGIDINTLKTIKNVPCSESSLGLYINSLFSSIIEDTINIVNKCKYIYTYSENLPTFSPFSYIETSSVDSLFHGNETLNTIPLQRIFDTISNIQKSISPKIIDMVTPETEIPIEDIVEVDPEEQILNNFINLSNKIGRAPIDGVEDERTIYWEDNKEVLKRMINKRFNHSLIVSRETTLDGQWPSPKEDIFKTQAEKYVDLTTWKIPTENKDNFIENLDDVLFEEDMLITADYLNGLFWWKSPVEEFVPYLYKHKKYNYSDYNLDQYDWCIKTYNTWSGTVENFTNMATEYFSRFSNIEKDPFNLDRITRLKFYHLNIVPFTLYVWRMVNFGPLKQSDETGTLLRYVDLPTLNIPTEADYRFPNRIYLKNNIWYKAWFPSSGSYSQLPPNEKSKMLSLVPFTTNTDVLRERLNYYTWKYFTQGYDEPIPTPSFQEIYGISMDEYSRSVLLPKQKNMVRKLREIIDNMPINDDNIRKISLGGYYDKLASMNPSYFS